MLATTDFGSGDCLDDRVAFACHGAFGNVEHREYLLAARAHGAQRRHGIRSLSRLADEKAEAAFRQWRFAVAEFAGDIGIHRNARDAFEPIAPDEAGVIRGAAGRHGDPADPGRIERQLRQHDGAATRIDHAAQAVADHGGMLVQLLLHEMAEAALAGGGARQSGALDFALHFAAGGVAEHRVLAREHGPVAIVQVGDAAGQGSERQGVRADEHLAIAKADGQRRAMAGADHQVRVSGEQKREGIGAFQPGKRRLRCLDGSHPAGEQIIDELRHRLGVGLRIEDLALRLELVPQLGMVFDDAVVHDSDASGAVRMGVVVRRRAMRGPAGVTDARSACQRPFAQRSGQIGELAFGAPALDGAVH